MRQSIAIGCLLGLAAPVAAEDQLVVHILCTGAQSGQGSGVIVSGEGHVLTAAHVMPDGSTCTASLGTTEGERVGLIRERVVEGFDAALARLDTEQNFPLYATVCPLEKERDIVTAAYHSRMTGPPARKQGIISTVNIEAGSVQITSPVIPAESGGPVFLKGTTALVGIVKGADFDALGLPIRRMVPATALSEIALTPAVDCRPKEAAVSAEIIGLIEALKDDLAKAAGDAGVTEKAIIFLAQRIAGEADTLEQALSELENAVDIAIDVQRRGAAPSAAGPFVEEVFREVAALSKDGQNDAASQAVDNALAQLDVAEASIRTARLELLETGIDTDLLRRDVPSAVARIVQKVTLETPDPQQLFEALRREQDRWYRRGTDKGVNIDLEVAIALAEVTVSRAASQEERGAARNDLGGALWRLGERESGTGRLEEAVTIHQAALKERPRESAPLLWAATQNDLGIVLQTLGLRESGTGRLEEAVSAFRAALEERTRDRVPLDWAATQNNIGIALSRLGERETGTGRFAEAVEAYRAALEVWTRDRLPIDWAATQNNLGNALQSLGVRESETGRLHEAIEAYRAALEVWTRDRVPLDWATAQNNLGNALSRLGALESETGLLDEAVSVYRAALEERTRDRVPLDWAQTQNNLGIALRTLGEREGGTQRLEEAVEAYSATLEEWTRERVPLRWAMTQNNLGNALQTLGEREGNAGRLEAAISAYRAALEEGTRERVPLRWAETQTNLGNALSRLGTMEAGTGRQAEALQAYSSALEVWTQESKPLRWAMTIENMSLIEGDLFRKTGEINYLSSASKKLESARVVYVESRASQFVENNSQIAAWIDGLKGE